MARDRTSRPEARPLRLFVAVDVPEGVRAGLVRDLERFRPLVPTARWTNPESWHVTLKFLGATWPRLVPEVERAVASAADRGRPFDSRLTHLGVFPGAKRARVVWAGLEDPQGVLAQVVKLLDDLLAGHFRVEKRGYTPHLTVARLKAPADIASAAPDLVGWPVESSPFSVDQLILYRSHLSPKGARYEPLGEFRL